MTTKQKIKLVTELVHHHKKLENLSDSISNIFGTCDGKLYDTVYNMFDAYTDAVSDAIGDDFEYVQWYIFENECGKRGLICSFGKKDCHIKTVSDLIEFIELTK